MKISGVIDLLHISKVKFYQVIWKAMMTYHPMHPKNSFRDPYSIQLSKRGSSYLLCGRIIFKLVEII